MKLSIIIPVGPHDDTRLQKLLASIERQAFPKEEYEVLCMREGNSEEARAEGIRQAKGEILCLLDTDNVLYGWEFLHLLTEAAGRPGVTGAYPTHYAYFRTDPPLTRYFALLGANDPLCWWLGKADRQSYITSGESASTEHIRHFQYTIPTLGSNGFFVKAVLAKPHTDAWARSHIDGCDAMRQAGHATYIITPNIIGHETADSLWSWLRKRGRYLDELYWGSERRWRMVSNPSDWLRVVGFALASLCVLPHVYLALRGYRRVRDASWALHPIACLSITLVYAWALMTHLWHRLCCVPIKDRRP